MKRLRIEKFLYLYKHWKLGVHLLVGTRYFGVNNQWWSNFPSFIFGEPFWRVVLNIVTIYPMCCRYRAMKYRATVLGFLHPDIVRLLGWYDEEK